MIEAVSPRTRSVRQATAGIRIAAVICSLALPAAAADEPPADAAAEVQHFVPPEKQLTASWKASLYDRAGRQLYQGAQLDAIGMPIGGIAAGQLYLCGDGTLGHWEIFNRHEFSGYGAHNYQKKAPAKPVDQGFAVLIQQDGRMGVYPLRRSDWAQVQWTGEYPIAWISYRDGRRPVSARMEAFSPFIPLNAPDSALPATLFQITLKNESDAPIQVGLLGWLENAVGIYSAAQGLDARRRSRILSGSPDRSSRRRYLIHCLEENPQARAAARPPVVFEDFEGPDYGDWQAQGSAFGRGPAQGTLANQQAVSGFLGKRLVNTYLGGDGTQGTLTSPHFTIERRYCNFLIGGGGHAGQTCMNLLVDGKVVRTASGANNEKLEWRSWDVQEYLGQKARFQIVDANTGGWGHVNIDQIEFADESRPMVRLADHPLDDGTMVLMAADAVSESLPGPLVETIKQTIGELNFQEDIAYDVRAKKSTVLAANFQTLEPQGAHTFSFVLSWHFPYHPHGHEYLNRFADAAAVAHYILDNRQKLSDQTHLWHDTYYDSTLPYWLLDRLHSTVANLATGTCQWWQSGRFWAWEGVECCPGTCTHVWNYEHALARLFPELERSVREMQDFGAGFEEGSGLVGFRSNRTYAADGQCGTVLKAYREHLLSADDAFLRRNWPKIKKTLEFSIRQDQNEDGLIENSQHNTFDINFFGANTFVGSLYLAALRAAEEMAREVGDLPFAERCRTIFASGSRLSSQKLWNGEYFIQDVDLAEHPKDQYDGGCLSDQMFGQGWACQLALGYLYPAEQVQAALRSVWKYNWAPDVGPHNQVHKPLRVFAVPGEAGLFTCTWPKSRHLGDNAVLYKNEVWTGIEYQVAGHLIWEGLTDEGLSIVRAIHERYQPDKRNPYNEVECGDHYARALASWGVFTALSGFEYHGPRGRIGFDPRVTPDDFRSAFTAAEGWGSFQQQRRGGVQKDRIYLRYGRLRLKEWALAIPETFSRPVARVRLGDAEIPATLRQTPGGCVLVFDPEIHLGADQVLDVEIAPAAAP